MGPCFMGVSCFFLGGTTCMAMMTSLSRDPGELSAGKEDPGPTLSIFEQMESSIIAIAMVP